jgi:hypothetical protein
MAAEVLAGLVLVWLAMIAALSVVGRQEDDPTSFAGELLESARAARGGAPLLTGPADPVIGHERQLGIVEPCRS